MYFVILGGGRYSVDAAIGRDLEVFWASALALGGANGRPDLIVIDGHG
jgi:hypothetical protein